MENQLQSCAHRGVRGRNQPQKTSRKLVHRVTKNFSITRAGVDWNLPNVFLPFQAYFTYCSIDNGSASVSRQYPKTRDYLFWKCQKVIVEVKGGKGERVVLQSTVNGNVASEVASLANASEHHIR